MPNLPHNPYPTSGDLRTYLTSVLPDSQLNEVTVNSAYQPLLLLKTKNVMAAFAFSNGDIRESYEALYVSFKTYYAKQPRELDTLDLSFNFCVKPDEPNLDNFCSTVETDVYFCRKFVVPLAQPLDLSLAHLPFLPLTSLNGQSMRPASAQTFLQQRSVPAVLAKFLVVQRERSPEGIVEDCASGKFGELREFTPVTSTPVVQSQHAAEPVLLETVTIQNFRNYRQPQTFAIGSEVTVLYGPNGFGKTSFFDAIDFAVTGGIGRIKTTNEAHFSKTARHLDSSKSEESTVAISFRCRDGVSTVTRSVTGRNHALLNGLPTDRKAILAELTGGDIPATDRVENFVSLFRATHLFSQEQQELIKDFEDDCLSEQIVSRMLALEDYVNAVNKLAKVCEVLQSVISTANAEIKALSEQITDEEKELDRLGQTAKAHTNVEALETEIEALRGKLIATGIADATQKPDVVTLRGWRANLEARHAESQSRIGRLATLAKEAAELLRVRADLASLQQQVTQKEQVLGTTDEKRIAAALELQRVEQGYNEMIVNIKETETRADILEFFRTTKPVYEQLIQKQSTLNDELNSATEALAQLRTNEENAASNLRTHENIASLYTEKMKTKRAEFSAVQSLNESIISWQLNLARLVAVVESEQTTVKSLELLRAEERELLPLVTEVTAEEARLSRQILEVDKSQSALNNLLSQLQSHVRTGTCPLCGDDHGSKDELVRSIQNHVATDAASDVRVDLAGVQERAKHLAEQITTNKQKQQATDAQFTSLKMERTRLYAEIAQFSDSALKLGVVIEESGSVSAELLQARHDRVQQEIGELNQQIQLTGVATEQARTRLANTKAHVTAKVIEITDKKLVLARLKEEVNQLRNDPRLVQVSFDTSDEQLTSIERLNREHLTGFQAAAAKAQTEAANKRQEVSVLHQESTSLKTQLLALRTQLANLNRTVTQITARLAESKLPADASEEMLLNLIAEESRTQAQLLTMRDSASNLELAIDAATTAAALTQLQNNVRNKEKAITKAVLQRDQHLPWLKYFEELSRIVSSKQNEATANFTREYGPRTSVIQRRLRSVYGFDEIEIQSRNSAISVRVKRHGEELRPTDYFSQSQQQTLLLGLFLTACSSQTWSAFSPVFLDDPVTHFDDLNTYAFLDLIVGLLDSDTVKRQFIISTCDEKLLQLARQKFRHLGEHAKFYRFSGISAEGPIIDEITAY